MTEPRQELPQDLAAAYVLGALTADEAREFEALLARSPEARREVAEFREVAALLAVATPGPAPASELRDRLLARLARDRAAPRPRATAGGPRTPVLWGALAASLIAVLGLGIGAFVLTRELTGARTALSHHEQAVADLQRQLASRESTLTSIFKPSVEMFQLTATGDPDPRIQLFWDRERHRAILHGIRLKPLPTSRAYQLWFIQDGKPVPSVTFTPAPSGEVQIENVPVPTGGQVSAAAITIEPPAGSPQPTSPIVMVGRLGKAE